MKKLMFILFFGLLFAQQFAIGGIPIQIKKTNDCGEARSIDISVEINNNNTISIVFNTDCGDADIIIETTTGVYVTSAYCPTTPDNVEIRITSPGCYVVTIKTIDGTYQGQFIIN